MPTTKKSYRTIMVDDEVYESLELIRNDIIRESQNHTAPRYKLSLNETTKIVVKFYRDRKANKD